MCKKLEKNKFKRIKRKKIKGITSGTHLQDRKTLKEKTNM